MTPALLHLMIVSGLVEVLVAIPVGLILRRTGLSPWWALLCFVPVAALLGLWLLAFMRWPRDAPAPP